MKIYYNNYLIMYFNNVLGLRPLPLRLMSSAESDEAHVIAEVEHAAMSFTLAIIFVMLVIG